MVGFRIFDVIYGLVCLSVELDQKFVNDLIGAGLSIPRTAGLEFSSD